MQREVMSALNVILNYFQRNIFLHKLTYFSAKIGISKRMGVLPYIIKIKVVFKNHV